MTTEQPATDEGREAFIARAKAFVGEAGGVNEALAEVEMFGGIRSYLKCECKCKCRFPKAVAWAQANLDEAARLLGGALGMY